MNKDENKRVYEVCKKIESLSLADIQELFKSFVLSTEDIKALLSGLFLDDVIVGVGNHISLSREILDFLEAHIEDYCPIAARVSEPAELRVLSTVSLPPSCKGLNAHV
jgi:hypothetical protein